MAGQNIAYTVHFYAGTHGAALRSKIQYALDKGVAVLSAPQWGTSLASGNGGPFLDQSRDWLRFLDQRGISWVNWSLCGKAETSAAFKSGTSLVPSRAGAGGFPVWDRRRAQRERRLRQGSPPGEVSHGLRLENDAWNKSIVQGPTYRRALRLVGDIAGLAVGRWGESRGGSSCAVTFCTRIRYTGGHGTYGKSRI